MQLFSFLSFFCMFHTKEQSHKRNYIHIIRLIDFYIIPLSKWNRDRIKNAIGAVSMQQNYERNKIEFVNSLFYTHNENVNQLWGILEWWIYKCKYACYEWLPRCRTYNT